MQILRQLTFIQRVIGVAMLGVAFALGFMVGEAAGSGWWGVPPNVPTGDFVVGAIASVAAAIVLVSAGAGIAKVAARLQHD